MSLREAKTFFLERKKQRTFIFWACVGSTVRDSATKVFCFFFSKKKVLFLFLCAAAPDPYLAPFSADSPWNRRVPAEAVYSADDDPRTRDVVAGHALIRAEAWAIPIYAARASDPWVQVRDMENARVFSAQVPVSARPDPMGDGHLVVVDPAHRFSLEMYRARLLSGGGIVARRAFRVDLLGPGMFLRDGKFPGVRAMDASGMGGVLRAWEIDAGRIDHVLTFSLPYSRLAHGPVWPSAREDFWGFKVYSGHVPIGTLVAIPRGVDLGRLGLSPGGLALGHALQDYGAYCDDSVGTDGIALASEPAAEGLPALAEMRRDISLLHGQLRVVLNNAR